MAIHLYWKWVLRARVHGFSSIVVTSLRFCVLWYVHLMWTYVMGPSSGHINMPTSPMMRWVQIASVIEWFGFLGFNLYGPAYFTFEKVWHSVMAWLDKWQAKCNTVLLSEGRFSARVLVVELLSAGGLWWSNITYFVMWVFNLPWSLHYITEPSNAAFWRKYMKLVTSLRRAFFFDWGLWY